MVRKMQKCKCCRPYYTVPTAGVRMQKQVFSTEGQYIFNKILINFFPGTNWTCAALSHALTRKQKWKQWRIVFKMLGANNRQECGTNADDWLPPGCISGIWWEQVMFQCRLTTRDSSWSSQVIWPGNNQVTANVLKKKKRVISTNPSLHSSLVLCQLAAPLKAPLLPNSARCNCYSDPPLTEGWDLN